MSNIAAVLKDEIARIARKEIRAETEALKKSSARYRAEIAELKRRLAVLEKAANISAKKAVQPAEESGEAVEKVRFNPKGLRSHRERLELSAADMAKLLNVSAQTLYNWELGKTRPRASQLASIAAVRKMKKAEVEAALTA